MGTTSLANLPPELLDHITAHLPTAHSLASLSSTSRRIHDFVENDAWQTFNRTRFPSLCPAYCPSPRRLARTLTTLSGAYDRRAVVVRHIEPNGAITAWPRKRPIEKWRAPRGQTIGFAPQLDSMEDQETRTETLAFSTGAELCLRRTRRKLSGHGDQVDWLTYRPLTAAEGRDDITTLHIVPPRSGQNSDEHDIITGTASGNLQLLRLPTDETSNVPITYFTTQGQFVRTSSLLNRPDDQDLLLASLDDSRLALYPVVPGVTKTASCSQVDIQHTPNAREPQGGKVLVWSTTFLSSTRIAVGTGPSKEPIHVYSLTPTGIDASTPRRFRLQNDLVSIVEFSTNGGARTGAMSSVYPIVALPPSSAAGRSDGNVFLSGGFDGVIRLHDQRSSAHVERTYVDPTDDSGIYSLLPRGQESLLAGSSRQSRLKFFDLRLGAKCYSYLDAWPGHTTPTGRDRAKKDWTLFMRQTGGANWGPARRNHWQQARAAQSSIYSLSSPSPTSPYVYAGAESTVLEMAFTAALDQHPDPEYFQPWKPAPNGRSPGNDPWRTREILDLAMVDQTPDMKLHTQKSVVETWKGSQSPLARTNEFPKPECLDERWRVGS